MAGEGNIVHVVLTQWRGEIAPEARRELTERITGFATEIPGIVSVTEGPSVSPEGLEGEFEWGLVVTFADAAARDVYLDHPAHLPVAKLIGDNAERVVVLDLAA
ncbi:Dabb family protein [Demequina zhanjiangensis]|uniref:Dabb family protein n=1 Tax=Demequina zhanjiangensis TaxID=3051659 RepID=A0ABT8G3L0_9MICO|nr:Dabb family protein [Demequina sp. SYSU T00b26]MDN4473725.1 Dabb family protein [Demequina sp. SYSU T00b26]